MLRSWGSTVLTALIALKELQNLLGTCDGEFLSSLTNVNSTFYYLFPEISSACHGLNRQMEFAELS